MIWKKLKNEVKEVNMIGKRYNKGYSSSDDTISMLKRTYLENGYSEEWINVRIKGIPVRNELTYEWRRRGANDNDLAFLTDEISLETFGITTKQHRDIKNLKKWQNLRDNMSTIELILIALAEITTTLLHRINDSHGISKLIIDAHDGGKIASITRKNIELKIGKSIVTSDKPIRVSLNEMDNN